MLLSLVLVGVTVAGVLAYRAATVQPGNVVNPDVEFDEREAEPEKPEKADKFQWPLYGYSKDHRRFYEPPRRLPIRGPWGIVWRHRAPALLEFPPVIYRDAIYQLADNGQLFSLRKNTGRVRWKRDLGYLSASSPAVGGGSLYVTVLERGRGVRAGRILSLRIKDGRIKWSRDLPSRSESSPLLHRGRIYFGTEGGTLYALNAHTGRTVWRYQADGPIKGSPTLANGKLFFGDYAGHVHAVRLSNGRKVWEAAAAARALRSGRFYATAAVAFGRVFIGSTDGRMYSLSARNGRLAWARQTGGYVYSSAAVRDVPRVGPTVYFGSYDGYLYALDARNGSVRWRWESGGRISGGVTIVGRAVFFADLGRSATFGLSLATGRVFFKRKNGAFDPIISDGRHLFQTGRSSLTALLPKAEAERVAREQRRSPAARRERRRRRAARERRERRVRAKALRRCERHTTRSATRRCRRAVFGLPPE